MNLLFGTKWIKVIIQEHSDLLNKIGGQSGEYEWNWDTDADEMLIRQKGQDHISIPAKTQDIKKILSGKYIDFQTSGLNRSQSKRVKEVLARRGAGWVMKLNKNAIDQLPRGLGGIYAIYNDTYEIIYTGRAKGTNSCIRKRVNAHFTGTDRQEIGKYLSKYLPSNPEEEPKKKFYFSYEIMDDYEDIKEAEAAEMLRMKPSYNYKGAEEKWFREFWDE